MSGPSELAIAAGVLVDVALKSTLLLGGVWGLTRLPIGSAAQRHVLWGASLAALPVLAVLAAERGAAVALDAQWLPVAWALGAAIVVLPLLRGLVEVWRLTRRSVPHPTRAGVRMSDSVSGPATWGVLRPVVLLPSAALSWPAAQLEAALLHERAHIQRGDWAVLVMARVVCALFWAQPLVWLALRELCLEAEHAADDVVVSSGVRVSDYAALLLSVACGQPPPAALGAGSSLLARRVRAVLGQRRRSARRAPVAMVMIVVAIWILPGVAQWPAWAEPEPDTLTCR